MTVLLPKTCIAIFSYNRPSHLRRLLISLENQNIKEAYVFLDGPKNFKDKILQKEIYFIVKYNPFIKLKLIAKKRNIGLAKSIINGVTSLSKKYDRLIILEDDCIPRKEFFLFLKNIQNMKEYKESNNTICGYQLPEIHKKNKLLYPIYLDYFIPWGWCIPSQEWLRYIKFKKNKNLKKINLNDNISKKILKISQKKTRNIWSLEFLIYNLYLKKKIIFPSISLIKNIGFDGSGVNSKITDKFNTFYKNVKVNRVFKKIKFDNKFQKKQVTSLKKGVKYFY